MAFYTHLRSAVGDGTPKEESQFLTGRKSNYYFKNIQSQAVLIKMNYWGKMSKCLEE